MHAHFRTFKPYRNTQWRKWKFPHKIISPEITTTSNLVYIFFRVFFLSIYDISIYLCLKNTIPTPKALESNRKPSYTSEKMSNMKITLHVIIKLPKCSLYFTSTSQNCFLIPSLSPNSYIATFSQTSFLFPIFYVPFSFHK